MAGTSVDIATLLTPERLACEIAKLWMEWNSFRAPVIDQMNETRRYLFAEDTRTTTNQKLPWKNTTTIPKLTQIRDNLIANYMATLFPKRKWQTWEGDNEASDTAEKTKAIEAYMDYVTGQPEFKKEIQKLVTDYIDCGNCFATPTWLDKRVVVDSKTGQIKVGYVGPGALRISPLDLVFNPVAADFTSAPKVVRKIVTMGELAVMLQKMTTEENRDDLEALWKYMRDIRENVSSYQASGGLQEKDDYLRVDGFNSYASYLGSSYVELLYFFGDMYDPDEDKLYNNHKIIVVDRHKIISNEPNPSYFGQAPIWHAGWRIRQDNLWAMGPLANLVGMQYRLDHLENLKADVTDLNAFPVLKIKGYVEDFEWAPMARIVCGDDGDVEIVAPPFQVLQVNSEIDQLTQKMEEFAGAPKEAMGFRNPGEKTMYEVQRMENAYNRIFQNKVSQFEEYVLEPLLNGMLELARRKMDSTQVPSFNSELSLTTFMTLTPTDITGAGRIRPLAARHFAERAEVLQNLNTFFQSPAWQDLKIHFSSEKMALMFEEFFDIEDWDIVTPYVAISEQAEAQRMMQSSQEQTMMEAGTPSGLEPDDVDTDIVGGVV